MRDLADRELEQLFELDDSPGPARPIDDARARAIIAAALGGAGFSPPGGDGGGSAPTGAAPVGRVAGRARLAVLSGGAAAIVVAAVAWLATRPPRAPSVPAIADPAAARAPAADEPEAAHAANDLPGASTRATAPPTRGPSPLPSPARPAHGAPPRAVMHRRPPRAQPELGRTADDLLAEANAARAQHRWRAADALYARVVADGQATLAVQTALVASASIHLEHLADPAGAARRFRDALAARPDDALAEEARWGVAEAARALADRAGELRALDDLLAHHPGSVRAARARARRTELGAP